MPTKTVTVNGSNVTLKWEEPENDAVYEVGVYHGKNAMHLTTGKGPTLQDAEQDAIEKARQFV